ncbi:HET domain-containing protein [Colletotrichum karsti]|uniref:HET domain-containing protein n=1 Tax=Colletotrichum karsti TaxID=1095194 RepID=A0A9P6IF52_9PEZI|nr:HET domain-containing protein [Colletotrichum karsti]KAF9880766.1 HET domain-containing protein [Colletotrichum karsti]
MWLINVNTLKLEEHFNPDVPYAVLSHTWGTEEVSFQEFKNSDEAVWSKKREGFRKIFETCRLASLLGLHYAWVDTCCIDKTSSAELSEAINSMFQWYQSSRICFVYLADMHDTAHSYTFYENLKACRWFTRGWTLQELIAPKMVTFYNSSWKLLGNKQTLARQLTWITGIDRAVLSNKVSLAEIPVGTRMSWAAKRQTTRLEDSAYCLLGLFEINMPLLYGEGTNAFARLQSEILQETNDLSLLAWTSDTTDPERLQLYSGVLATSPDQFVVCSNLEIISTQQLISDAEILVRKSYLQLSAELHARQFASHETETADHSEYVLSLCCRQKHGTPPTRTWICMGLSKVPSGYIRHKPWMLVERWGDNDWSYDKKAKPLKLLRHIGLVGSNKLQDARFKRAVFVRLDSNLGGQQNPDPTLTAIPDTLWDGLHGVFLDKDGAQFPSSPYLVQITLPHHTSTAKLLLVSLISRAQSKSPERWAMLLSDYQDPIGKAFWAQLGDWDQSSTLRSRLPMAMLSKMTRSRQLSIASADQAVFPEPAEGVATPARPASRTLQISEHRRITATISIVPNDAGDEACSIIVSIQDVDARLHGESQIAATNGATGVLENLFGPRSRSFLRSARWSTI